MTGRSIYASFALQLPTPNHHPTHLATFNVALFPALSIWLLRARCVVRLTIINDNHAADMRYVDLNTLGAFSIDILLFSEIGGGLVKALFK